MKFRKPKESFIDFMSRKDEERFLKDMSEIYGCGYFILSRKNISSKDKRKLQLKIEQIIDKRITYYNRKYKLADGKWRHLPASWDERNKKSIYNLYDKYKRHK